MKNKLVEEFMDFTRIDSPSGEEKAVREYVLKKLDDLGFTYVLIMQVTLLLKMLLKESPFYWGRTLIL